MDNKKKKILTFILRNLQEQKITVDEAQEMISDLAGLPEVVSSPPVVIRDRLPYRYEYPRITWATSSTGKDIEASYSVPSLESQETVYA